MICCKKQSMQHRFSDLLDHGVGRVQDVADEVQSRVKKESKVLSKKAKAGYSDSLEALGSAEDVMLRTVRENPGLIAGLLLIVVGLVVGAMIVRNRRRDETAEEDW